MSPLSSSPSANSDPCQLRGTVRLDGTTIYDKGGLARRVTRKAAPDLAHLDSLVTRTGYDAAGRKVADTATDGLADQYQYDQAGHVIVHVSRNGTIVTWQYDAVGELVAKDMGGGTTPGAVEVDSAFVQWAPGDFAQNAGDLDLYTYDAGGRLIAADNQTAQIRRTYMPNGALLTDSLRLDTWAQNEDFSRHVFPLAHTYDLDGRRRATSGVTSDSVVYDLAGRVSGIEASGGGWFRYAYDTLGRPDTVTYPNGAMLLQSYDAQDDMRTRREQLPPGSDSADVNADTLTYDARGKVVHAVGHTEEDFEGYSALGTLWASERNNVRTGAFNNTENFTADAMGTVVIHAAQRKDLSQQSVETDTNVYAPKTGRLLGTANGTSQTLVTYTPGGDRMIVDHVTGAVPEESFGGLDDARYYYRADGLLAAVDHRTCTFLLFPETQCESDSVSLGGSFEDYRYDALGRRVLVRTRTETVCTGANCHSALMWVAWDGDQIAEEVRGAGSTTLSDDSLELGLPPGDPAQQPFYGTVSYLNGPTLDRPLEIQGIIPYRTWRELIDGGACGDCALIDFPGLTYEAALDVIPSKRTVPRSWHGSLFADGLDDSGLMYRRNRYYDPATGQFTQEDPLGLAGGMNAYGFAHGDPVNYDDPFGLFSGYDEGPVTEARIKALREIGQAHPKLAIGAGLAMIGASFGAAVADAIEGIAGAYSAIRKAYQFRKAPYGSTPEGRPLTKHYGTVSGPKRNIPGSVVDHTINNTEGVPGRDNTTVHYDPDNNVTVVTGKRGIVTAHKGEP